MRQKILCKSSQGSYEIEIDNGILLQQADYLFSLASRFAIITDDIVGPIYGDSLKRSLSGKEVHLFSFPHGEKNKTRFTKETLENQLFEKKLGRDTCIIALGGGVVTDIAGYLAATYCRGVPLVMMPTSLLAMVDASIGGKTGVNVPYGKNLVGTIYPPKKVVIDSFTLKSLPKSEFAQGISEVIKYGLIADNALFTSLEGNSSLLEEVIFKSCLIKKEIVEEDEKEIGKRRLLNFGHTIGHALEKATHHKIPHGEAVAIGILAESYLSMEVGGLKKSAFERIKQLLLQYKLPLRLPSLPIDLLLDAMTLDKKSLQGRARFVILSEIGSPLSYDENYCTFVETSLIKKTLDWLYDDLCCH